MFRIRKPSHSAVVSDKLESGEQGVNNHSREREKLDSRPPTSPARALRARLYKTHNIHMEQGVRGSVSSEYQLSDQETDGMVI